MIKWETKKTRYELIQKAGYFFLKIIFIKMICFDAIKVSLFSTIGNSELIFGEYLEKNYKLDFHMDNI